MVYGTSHEILRTTSEPHQNHTRTRHLIIHIGNCCIFVTLWGIFRKNWDIPDFFVDIPEKLPYVLFNDNATKETKQ